MTLGLACLLFGALLIYAGVKGLSLSHLLRGDNTTSGSSGNVSSS